MVQHCFTTKYYGPTCYDITEEESRNLKSLNFLVIISFVTLLILWLISYLWKDVKLTQTTLFKAVAILALSTFIVYIFYEYHVRSRSRILCTGYFDCSKI